MQLNLEDRVAVVGGATRGIGLAIAETLLAEGARVVLTGRDPARLRGEADRLERGHAGRVERSAGDLGGPTAAAAAVECAVSRWGRIDVAVANAGTGAGRAGVEQSDAEWESGFTRNFLPARRLVDAALPRMSESGRGAIVIVTSIVSLEALAAPLPYVAAKTALSAYIKSVARAVGRSGVRVNGVAPGNILFPGGSWEAKSRRDPDGVREYIEREVPLGRFGSPGEIADCVAFLCSDRASFVTGATLVADGGQTRRFGA